MASTSRFDVVSSSSLQAGAEPCTSPRPDPERRAGAGNDDLASSGPEPSNVSPFDWIKTFLVMLLVIKAAVTWNHRDACVHVEGVWPANIHGTDLCTLPFSNRRWKRRPAACNGTSSDPGRARHMQYCLPCFAGVMCLQSCMLKFSRNFLEQSSTHCWGQSCKSASDAADVDHDMCVESVHDLLHCSGRRHDDVPPVPSSSETWLFPLALAADEEMVTSSPSTMARFGDQGDIRLMEEHLIRSNPDDADDTASMSMWRDVGDHGSIIPDFIDSTDDASMGVEQPIADGDTPWWSIPGLRFLPTDLEIVLHHLKHKVLKAGLPEHSAMREGVDVYGTNADQITLDVDNGGKEQLGFFLVRKAHAYSNGCWYPTPDGYWKVRRGQPAAIKHDGRVIAFKTTMDYVRGRAPHGRRTPWSMSEYALNARHDDLRNLTRPTMNSFVVCKVRKRVGVKKRPVLLRRFGPKKDRARKPKVRRQVVSGGGGVLGKRKHPDL